MNFIVGTDVMEESKHEKDAPKKEYQTPKLEVYGELRVVIKGAGSNVFDGGTFSCAGGPDDNPGFC